MGRDPLILHFLKILVFEKTHLLSKLIFKGTQLGKNTGKGYLSKNTILHLSVKYDFGSKRCSSCSSAVFIKKFYFCRKKTEHSWGFNAFSNKEKLKRKSQDNLRQNIRRLFNFLAKFLFTTCETELDYYHQEVSTRVASRVSNKLRLKILED